MENFVIRQIGGARRRPGWRYIAAAKAAGHRCQLVSFVPSADLGYVLEFSDQTIRFFRNGAAIGAPLEVTTPYLAADLGKLRWAQSADVLYLACEGYAPRKLSRTSDTDWVLSLINFRPPATEEKDLALAADLTLSAVTGTGITVTASASVFLAADVDREITAGVGRLVITAFTSGTVVTADVLDDFTSVNIPAAGWVMKGSPGATLTPNKKEPTGAQVTLTAGINAFRATDVGKYVHIHNGIVKITTFTSATVVKGSILVLLEAVTGTTNWTLESESWTAADGFPVDVGFIQEDRLVWVRDDRVWASSVGDYENMGETTLDDAAFSFGLRGSAEVPNARGVIGANEIQVFTSSGEFTMSGGNDNPITPTNIRVQSDTNEGSARVRQLRVNGVTLFANKSGRGVMEFVFSYEPNRFLAPNLSLLAPHLFPVGTQIVEMGYQRTPDSTVWVVRSDGLLLALAYQREQNVVGWTRHTSEAGAASVESVAVVPHPNGDREQVWLAVRRTVNGATVRSIEIMDDTSLFTDVNGVSYGQANLDACKLYNAAPATVFTGLGHLEGKSVRVVADGNVLEGAFTVTGGQITLATAASKVEVGLMYDSTLITIRPEIQAGDGTIQGRRKRQARVYVRLFETLGITVNGHAVNFRLVTDLADQPPPLYTGDIPRGHGGGVMNLGWDREGRLAITQEEPLPATIVMVATLMGVGG